MYLELLFNSPQMCLVCHFDQFLCWIQIPSNFNGFLSNLLRHLFSKMFLSCVKMHNYIKWNNCIYSMQRIFGIKHCSHCAAFSFTLAAPQMHLFAVYMWNYQKIDRKLKKYWGKINSFLPWTKNLKWTPRPSFCTQVKRSCVW